MDQQRQLEALHAIVQQQNKYISKLCKRDARLGLELRAASINKDVPTDDSDMASAAIGTAFFLSVLTI